MPIALAAPLVTSLDWVVVNDTVMGGVSASTVKVDTALRFTGTLSLERNGGFASVRSRPTALPLAGARAIKLTLRGDGRVYDFTLSRSDFDIRAGSYRVRVRAEAKARTLEIPLSDFRPTRFGRPMSGAPALDAGADRIDSAGFLLADGKPGPFALEVLAIEPVSGAAKRSAQHPAVIAALKGAVAQGVPAFNAGDHARCRSVYAAALSAAIAAPGALTPGERRIVSEALDAARPQADTDAAWTLRSAIDSVLWSAG